MHAVARSHKQEQGALAVAFEQLTKSNLQALRLLNAAIFPLRYPDQVYSTCMQFPHLTCLGGWWGQCRRLRELLTHAPTPPCHQHSIKSLTPVPPLSATSYWEQPITGRSSWAGSWRAWRCRWAPAPPILSRLLAERGCSRIRERWRRTEGTCAP